MQSMASGSFGMPNANMGMPNANMGMPNANVGMSGSAPWQAHAPQQQPWGMAGQAPGYGQYPQQGMGSMPMSHQMPGKRMRLSVTAHGFNTICTRRM